MKLALVLFVKHVFVRISNGFMRVMPLCRYRYRSLVMTIHDSCDSQSVVSKLFSDVKQEKMAELPFSSLKGTKDGRF